MGVQVPPRTPGMNERLSSQEGSRFRKTSLVGATDFRRTSMTPRVARRILLAKGASLEVD